MDEENIFDILSMRNSPDLIVEVPRDAGEQIMKIYRERNGKISLRDKVIAYEYFTTELYLMQVRIADGIERAEMRESPNRERNLTRYLKIIQEEYEKTLTRAVIFSTSRGNKNYTDGARKSGDAMALRIYNMIEFPSVWRELDDASKRKKDALKREDYENCGLISSEERYLANIAGVHARREVKRSAVLS